MRYLHVIFGIIVLLSAYATAGSFKSQMDVDTYLDVNNANQSFSEKNILWAASVDDKPTKEVYLSFINLFGSNGIFKPEQIESATLTLNATEVEKPGEIKVYLVNGATLDTTTWSDKLEYDSGVSALTNIPNEGSYSLNATALIKKAVETCPEGCPYSLVLVAQDNTSVGFASGEMSQEDMPSLIYVTSE